MKKPSLPVLIFRRTFEPLYVVGSFLHDRGINPEVAAVAAAIALSMAAITAQDRAFIAACQQAGGSVEFCHLKISGR